MKRQTTALWPNRQLRVVPHTFTFGNSCSFLKSTPLNNWRVPAISTSGITVLISLLNFTATYDMWPQVASCMSFTCWQEKKHLRFWQKPQWKITRRISQEKKVWQLIIYWTLNEHNLLNSMPNTDASGRLWRSKEHVASRLFGSRIFDVQVYIKTTLANKNSAWERICLTRPKRLGKHGFGKKR